MGMLLHLIYSECKFRPEMEIMRKVQAQGANYTEKSGREIKAMRTAYYPFIG